LRTCLSLYTGEFMARRQDYIPGLVGVLCRRWCNRRIALFGGNADSQVRQRPSVAWSPTN